ncbi:sulfotransferase family 2 domain-containing protein [Pokkaliibacter plantistimulans]|uniref:sulfotransferase family 2 domain-containing protein n=1 Tax=Pokkaliibacter plantistimulans TaxID=1635171 RepID=UPI000D74D54D|nr:sulfotransferase family 2 domain-containing protein [Pokkaliibacter plantistimulans]
MLISVHIPKTAGTSFGKSLEKNFGPNLIKDYGDFPILTPELERNRMALSNSIASSEKNFGDVKCIHGHFLAIKYLLLSSARPVTYVTWMRNPVERVLSHYYFWKRYYDPNTSRSFHKKMVEEDWSLERFCLGEEIRNLYSKFLYGFPLEYFSFIGIVEHFQDDFDYFANEYLSCSLEPEILNTRPNDSKGYEISDSLRSSIEAWHSKDMALYERAVAIRSERISRK